MMVALVQLKKRSSINMIQGLRPITRRSQRRSHGQGTNSNIKYMGGMPQKMDEWPSPGRGGGESQLPVENFRGEILLRGLVSRWKIERKTCVFKGFRPESGEFRVILRYNLRGYRGPRQVRDSSALWATRCHLFRRLFPHAPSSRC
jgi:hypothetical protein